ncbi:hypothetical protein RHECNPAF_1260059 [Rhizobium etli CNPAF512]|nr:hypothetical protein RHECNPAF_1260059 [Rhizobium etli CNPAF512]
MPIAQRPLCEKRSISASGRRLSRSRWAAPAANSSARSLAIRMASASSRMTWARRRRGAMCGAGRPAVSAASRCSLRSFVLILGSVPGVARRMDAVQIIIADVVVFPAHGIMQRMDAGIAPVAVESMLSEGRARSRKFEQFVRRQDRNFRGQNLGFACLDRRLRDRLQRRIGARRVDGVAGDLEQRFGRMQLDLQVADLGDGEEVFAGRRLAAVDPGAAIFADELDRVVDRAPGDADIDRRLDDLRDGAAHRRMVERSDLQRPRLRHAHIFDLDRTRRSGALAEARPVVGDGETRGIAVGKDEIALAGLVDTDDRHDMGKKRAGRVKFLAVDDHLVAVMNDLGFEIGDGPALQFGEGVAISDPFERPAEEQLLLLCRAVEIDGRDDRQMVLGDLRDGRIGCSDDGDHLGERGIGDFRTTIGFRHVDAPETALRIGVELGDRQQPLTVTQGGPDLEARGQRLGDLDRLLVAPDHMRRLDRARTGREGIGGIDARMDAVIDLGVGDASHGKTSSGWIGMSAGIGKRNRLVALEGFDVAVTVGRMRLGQIRPLAEQLLPQRAGAIAGRIDAALLQFRHQIANDILEALGRYGISKVEAVDVGLVDPGLEFVGNGGGRSHDHRSHAADTAPFGQLPDRPALIRIAFRQALDRRMDGVGLDLAHEVIRRVAGKVDAGPAGHEDQRAIIGNVVEIVAEFGARLLVGLVHDDRHQIIDAELRRVAPDGRRPHPDIAHIVLQDRPGLCRDEDAFRMLRRELLARPGSAGLVEHRGPLRRRLGQGVARHFEETALVADLVHLRGIGEDAPLAVAQHSTLFPGPLKELVDDLQIFARHFVAVVMRAQSALPDILGAALQIGGHDIPADPPLCQVVGGGQTPREGIGVLERDGSGDADAEMFGGECNRRRELDRIIDRNLRRLMDGVVVVGLVDVVIANHVGDEDAIEDSLFERPGKILPVVQILVFPGFVTGMGPKAGRLVADAVHVEGVEVYLLGHSSIPSGFQAWSLKHPDAAPI